MASLDARADPILTKILIGLNVLAFLAASPNSELFVDGALLGGWIYRDVGFIGVDAGEWWRLVTGGFLHANLMHIGFNMYLLWVLGSQLEPFLGRLRFGLLYAGSLLAGSFGVMLLDPSHITVGASGAVFGLMGATLVAQRAQGVNPWQSSIGGLVAINLVLTFVIPGISIGGHLGGLVGGAIAAAAYIELPRLIQIGDRRTTELATSAVVSVLGAAFVVGSLLVAGRWTDSFF